MTTQIMTSRLKNIDVKKDNIYVVLPLDNATSELKMQLQMLKECKTAKTVYEDAEKNK